MQKKSFIFFVITSSWTDISTENVEREDVYSKLLQNESKVPKLICICLI